MATMTPGEFINLVDKIANHYPGLSDNVDKVVAAYTALYAEVGQLTHDKPQERTHSNPAATWQIGDESLPCMDSDD